MNPLDLVVRIILPAFFAAVGTVVHVPLVIFPSTFFDCATISSFPQQVFCDGKALVSRIAHGFGTATSTPTGSFSNRMARRSRTAAWQHAANQSMVPSWHNSSVVDFETQCHLPYSLQRPLDVRPLDVVSLRTVHLGLKAPVVDLATQCQLPNPLQRPLCSPWNVQDDVASPTAYNLNYAAPQVVLYYSTMSVLMATLPILSVSSKVPLLDAGAAPEVPMPFNLSLLEFVAMVCAVGCSFVALAQLFPSNGRHETRSASSKRTDRKSRSRKLQLPVASESSTLYATPPQVATDSEVNEPDTAYLSADDESDSAVLLLQALGFSDYTVSSDDEDICETMPTKLSKSKKRKMQAKRQKARKAAEQASMVTPSMSSTSVQSTVTVDADADEQPTDSSSVVVAMNTLAPVLPAAEATTTGTGSSVDVSLAIEVSPVASVNDFFEASTATDELESPAESTATSDDASEPAAIDVTTSALSVTAPPVSVLDPVAPTPSAPDLTVPFDEANLATATPPDAERIAEVTTVDESSDAADSDELPPAAAADDMTTSDSDAPAIDDTTTSEVIASLPEPAAVLEELILEPALPVVTNPAAELVASEHAILESQALTEPAVPSVAVDAEELSLVATCSEELPPAAADVTTSEPIATDATVFEPIASVPASPAPLEELSTEPGLPVELIPTAEPVAAQSTILKPETITESALASVAANADELQPAAAVPVIASEPTASVPESTTLLEELFIEPGLPVELNPTAAPAASSHASLESYPATLAVDDTECAGDTWNQVDRKPRTSRGKAKRPYRSTAALPLPLLQHAQPAAPVVEPELKPTLVNKKAWSVHFDPPTFTKDGEVAAAEKDLALNEHSVVPQGTVWNAPRRADGSTTRFYQYEKRWPVISTADAPATDKPAADEPIIDKSTTDKPATNQPTTDQPTPETSTTEAPPTEELTKDGLTPGKPEPPRNERWRPRKLRMLGRKRDRFVQGATLVGREQCLVVPPGGWPAPPPPKPKQQPKPKPKQPPPAPKAKQPAKAGPQAKGKAPQSKPKSPTKSQPPSQQSTSGKAKQQQPSSSSSQQQPKSKGSKGPKDPKPAKGAKDPQTSKGPNDPQGSQDAHAFTDPQATQVPNTPQGSQDPQASNAPQTSQDPQNPAEPAKKEIMEEVPITTLWQLIRIEIFAFRRIPYEWETRVWQPEKEGPVVAVAKKAAAPPAPKQTWAVAKRPRGRAQDAEQPKRVHMPQMQTPRPMPQKRKARAENRKSRDGKRGRPTHAE